MPKLFSKQHHTYEEWRIQAPNTAHTRRIEKAHARYPDATYSQLRGHPKARERSISKLKERGPHQKKGKNLYTSNSTSLMFQIIINTIIQFHFKILKTIREIIKNYYREIIIMLMVLEVLIILFK